MAGRGASIVPLSVYVKRDSPIHRMPAGPKLALVIGFIVLATIFARTIPTAAGALAIALGGYALARIPVKVALSQLFGAVPLLAFIAVIQGLTGDWELGIMLFLQILACVIAATLLTLTTRVSDLMDTFDRLLAPLGKLGLPVATISLAMSLTLRLIPLQVQAVRDVLDARKARGAAAPATAFGVPVLIRTIRRSRAMSDALLARGVGD
ncbi:energy-coupling factor transporter transmembrane component T family protein [Corynebacterium hansenii]|uniref:Energy-coupling factor transporter transmembrane component T family protein n=1 Tax=Corynebacterium hansenii TaxID=394964 RepID=A0ABV7ZRI3_9CORY|nr:energy-coupling factor transporter transmembrane protein EcfT [Corynebacterium hansenii]WJY99797.1 Energy-coupling factor transporter transmembrane protein BioN [Corynebacterium hansenii]